jgi:hypothetical protein
MRRPYPYPLSATLHSRGKGRAGCPQPAAAWNAAEGSMESSLQPSHWRCSRRSSARFLRDQEPYLCRQPSIREAKVGRVVPNPPVLGTPLSGQWKAQSIFSLALQSPNKRTVLEGPRTLPLLATLHSRVEAKVGRVVPNPPPLGTRLSGQWKAHYNLLIGGSSANTSARFLRDQEPYLCRQPSIREAKVGRVVPNPPPLGTPLSGQWKAQ